MQKILFPILAFLAIIAINVGLSKFMINQRLPEESAMKILVVDMNELMTNLSVNQKSPQQVLADSQNLFNLLKIKGYLVIDKTSVLTMSDSYRLPDVNMRVVNKALIELEANLVTAEDMNDLFLKSAAQIEKEFSLTP
jgi:hypothetical protein